jgi:glycosyl hydrolase family 43
MPRDAESGRGPIGMPAFGRKCARAVGTLAVLSVGACLLAVVTAPAGAGASTRKTDTSTSKPFSVIPPVRAGQPLITPGHSATHGPIGANPAKAKGIQLTILSGLLHGEPIYNGDFADPFGLYDGDTVYAYATNTTGGPSAKAAHIPVIAITRATGFAGHYLGDALPTLPKWTVSGYQWAPSIWARPDGTFVMYYSTPATDPLNCIYKATNPGCVMTTHGANTAMCISRATSTSPSGPFVDDSSSPFVCPSQAGGAIDPSIYIRSDGTPWLLWKSDGDCCNQPTYIYSQQLSPDGLSTVGLPHQLIGATQSWEGGLVEAPSMIKEGSTYWLFYSANLWGTPNYSIGIASCATVTGPCTKPLDRAWHVSTNSANGQGYGGSEFFQTGSLIWMVHHGLVPGEAGNYAQRRLYVDLLVFPAGGLPEVAARAPAAAMAEAELYDEDPSLPKQPEKAYTHLISTVPVPGAFARLSAQKAISDGEVACAGLAKQDGPSKLVASLNGRGLTDFESYIVAEFGAQYLCPSQVPREASDMQRALLAGT